MLSQVATLTRSLIVSTGGPNALANEINGCLCFSVFVIRYRLELNPFSVFPKKRLYDLHVQYVFNYRHVKSEQAGHVPDVT